MSLSAAVLDAMVASGCTAEQIAAVVKADMAASESTKARKRANNNERQRRFRAKRAVTPVNACNALPSVTPPNDIYSNPPVFPQSPDGDCPPAAENLIEEAVSAWNAMAGRAGLAEVRGRLAGSRLAMLKARIAEHGPASVAAAIAAVERSPFCRGETKPDWRADFKFMVRPDNFAKLLEGGYDAPRRQQSPPGQPSGLSALLKGAERYRGMEPLRSTG
ncbi:hypothetical protein SAMN06295912_13525 [Sphingomonas laterariae]|uniref:Uncharacterized protein n=1 Tax=Edaphosphingomonas laterariae TaxID=861865 RepID=A0A239JIP4_9SPHN|nr:hypothetical protein [Sphingomonas laterariae]SNT05761.1 hypothetical protein SAMN06295912_13525 [Sphingomonas laterariae]